MEVKTQDISIKLIEANKGQIEGLPKNPRIIKDHKFEKLVKSIEENPEMLNMRELLVYPHGGKFIVIGGNMRLEALKKLGYKSAPCKVIPESATVEQLRAYTIKDNNGYGEWDFDLLAGEWDAELLDDWGVDLPAWEEEDEKTLEDVSEDDFNEEDEDIAEKCQRGDVWQLGEHRLMCGDSTNAEDVAKLMGGAVADMWLTDPPYNVGYEGGTKDKLTIKNDNMSDSIFREFLVLAFRNATEFLKAGGAFYIWHADSEGFNFRGAVRDSGMKVRECLIWNKNAMVLGRQDYQWKHESCLYGWKEGASHNWYNGRSETTVIDYDKPLRNGEHPTMKPVGLFAYLVKNSSKQGDIILDTFGGSGTTIIACEQLKRKCYMMELDEHYCDVIIARWEKETGKEAVKL